MSWWGGSNQDRINAGARFLNDNVADFSSSAAFGPLDNPISEAGRPGRGGCATSTDCASGWRCVNRVCTNPQNTPGSVNQGSGNDSGCGGNDGSSSGGGAGYCVGNYSGYGGDCTGATPGGSSDDLGCGSSSGADSCACTGTQRCCAFRTFGTPSVSVYCECGPCQPNIKCQKFCSDYSSAVGSIFSGCRRETVCNECTTCESVGFSGTSTIYECLPRLNAPCHCNHEKSVKCGDCKVCNDLGQCQEPTTPVETCLPPEEEEPEDPNPCTPEGSKECEYDTYTATDNGWGYDEFGVLVQDGSPRYLSPGATLDALGFLICPPDSFQTGIIQITGQTTVICEKNCVETVTKCSCTCECSCDASCGPGYQCDPNTCKCASLA